MNHGSASRPTAATEPTDKAPLQGGTVAPPSVGQATGTLPIAATPRTGTRAKCPIRVSPNLPSGPRRRFAPDTSGRSHRQSPTPPGIARQSRPRLIQIKAAPPCRSEVETMELTDPIAAHDRAAWHSASDWTPPRVRARGTPPTRAFERHAKCTGSFAAPLCRHGKPSLLANRPRPGEV
jgi:hypothetical protein